MNISLDEELPDYNDLDYEFSCSGTTCTLTLSDGQEFLGFLDQQHNVVNFRGVLLFIWSEIDFNLSDELMTATTLQEIKNNREHDFIVLIKT